MVPEQSIVPKINEHLPPEIRVVGEFILIHCLFIKGAVNPACVVKSSVKLLQVQHQL